MTRILIVDDYPELRALIRLTLRQTPYELYEATNGEEALRLAHELIPDLMILDVMMPGRLDGLQVCQAIKNTRQLSHCQVLLVSARGQQSDLLEGKRVGADGYLVKPFSPSGLLRTVRERLPETA
ncbi:response regulator (plasmid) [Deinococcus sp. KNUC1210]|uniref:response regulator transcription factor n=1 Tax=Deinococcus sp. KNUC1210 TaxID=2917691 RepID=UPI001EEFACDE|nr:response regulator [Deinococcus sp. KNUC1210]ULH17741.1 response regulator [Deinococcus sp. KNUC1210]